MFDAYVVRYSNGTEQVKRLVPAAQWDEVYGPARRLVGRCKGAKQLPDGVTREMVKEAERLLEELPENFFVEDSPLGLAMATGTMVLPPQQGGEHPVSFRPA